MADEVAAPPNTDQHTVKVAVRVRPLSEKEIRESGEDCTEVGKDGETITLKTEGSDHSFAFDHVFDTSSTQPQVFDALGMPLLDKAFEGYNSTIFAYGQTGSGKTHTMMADRKSVADKGLIPRISENLFVRINALSSDTRKFLICCSFLEIYNEIVYDLLAPRGKTAPKTGLEIREQKGIGVYVKDLQEIVVDNSDKLQKLIDQGFENRATAETKMNASSSRSHCLFIIKMHQKDETCTANNNFCKMNLVDLAGSERAAKTGAEGDRLKEGANINKSLSALGNVVNALSSQGSGSKKVFIPYRNSKLTRVLQESLGGNALTTMMAAVSPSKTNLDETLSTLNYAKRAKTIKVNATKNDEAEQITKLEEEVEALKAKLAQQASGVADTSRYEQQLAEMEVFMKQTWADKEKATQKHEEERKNLELQAQKRLEQANAERNRRLRLLEEKGDLELSMQDLRSLEVSGFWAEQSTKWQASIAKLITMEKTISAQCRAVRSCKDAVLQDVAAWCEAAKSDDDGGASGRMMIKQAERKAEGMVRELGVLKKYELELEEAVAAFQPAVRRVIAGTEKARQQEAAEAKEEKEGNEKEESHAGSEEWRSVLALIGRQVDQHQAKAWGDIGNDHKKLADLRQPMETLLSRCAELGANTEELSKELELEASSASGSTGAEAAAALSSPVGVVSGQVLDGALTASSNSEAAPCGRLLHGASEGPSSFGGWCPAKAAIGEYLQVDLGGPRWISGISLQGRRPASNSWEQTRPLLAKVLEPSDPLPPEKVFKRPPVRLIHDVVVAVHTRHKIFDAVADSTKAFPEDQLTYKAFQNCDRQQKIDFFELLIAKIKATLVACQEDGEVSALAISAGEILGGKNTPESNRMLQTMCYLALRKKMPGAGGLVACSEQWVTKYTVECSTSGDSWFPLVGAAGESNSNEPLIFEGNSDADGVKYSAFGASRPSQPVRFVRARPIEWNRYPGMRLEIFGWADGSEKNCADAASLFTDRTTQLEVVKNQAALLKRVVALASATAAERWQQAQHADREQRNQQMAEKDQVDKQLADALVQIEELLKDKQQLEEQVADTQQKLIDTDTAKLKLEVDRDRAEAQVQSLEQTLASAYEANNEESSKNQEIDRKANQLQEEKDDLERQVGVLTEERDCSRLREEELFETLQAKEEELMNTNEGYVYLTDQLGEVRDDLEEKIDDRDRAIETLEKHNKDLFDETADLRKQLGDANRKLAEAERALKRAEQGMPVRWAVQAGAPSITATTAASEGDAGPDGEKEAKPASPAAGRKKRKGHEGGGESEHYDEDFENEDEEEGA